jgi:hypothetical protein
VIGCVGGCHHEAGLIVRAIVQVMIADRWSPDVPAGFQNPLSSALMVMIRT